MSKSSKLFNIKIVEGFKIVKRDFFKIVKIVKSFKMGKSVYIVKSGKSVKIWQLQRLHLAHLLYSIFGIFNCNSGWPLVGSRKLNCWFNLCPPLLFYHYVIVIIFYCNFDWLLASWIVDLASGVCPPLNPSTPSARHTRCDLHALSTVKIQRHCIVIYNYNVLEPIQKFMI